MNLTLFKLNIKNNSGLMLIFLGVLSMYMVIMMYMFDPLATESMNAMMASLPPEMVSAFGFDSAGSTLISFMAGFYYSFLIFMFPMVYYIILSNKLVAKMVDSGSMAYLLQTPVSRKKIIFTQGIYLLFSIGMLFTLLFGVGMLASNTMFPGMMDVDIFFKLHFSAMLLTMASAMISFFYSCLFNESRKSLAFGAGIPITFILLMMIGDVSDKGEFFSNLSLFSLLDAIAISQNGSVLGINILFVCIIVILFGASIIIFDKKRLPI